MATLLDDGLVADAMTNLPDWTGDASRISRTVEVDDPDALVAAVSEDADALDHHPVVDRNGAAVTFTLWTHSMGGVTELDIALASRINDHVLAQQHLQRTATGEVVAADDDTGAGATVTATPTKPAGEQTTPSRPETSETGEAYPTEPHTFNPSAAPRQGAGPVVLPDASPDGAEPQPGNAPAPGMHEATTDTG
jgi:4a-hydroxytetrahydrobiopterin dehydratase